MNKQKFWWGLGLLAAFILWTAAVSFWDVQPVGPNGSCVGFATVNVWFHSLTGCNRNLYVLTDWLGLVPVAVGFGFAALGLCQWIRRRDIRKVDADLWLLGGFYIVTLGAYLLFEEVVINYRPVLIEGFLEASYPSSTTLLVLCVMPTAAVQLKSRIQKPLLRKLVLTAIWAFAGFMVVGRLLSGVHWLTDIIGGLLLSTSLVMLYCAKIGSCLKKYSQN